MLDLSKKIFLTASFTMSCSFTSVMLMPIMCHMLRCTNTSIFFRRDVRSAHLSHTHRSKLIGAEIKTGHLMQMLMLAYVQNLVRALIDEFNAARYTSML